MDEEVKQRRRLLFGAYAEAYDRARPTFPPDAAAWICGLDPAGVGGGGADVGLDVVELGAGTGKLTRVLVEAGHNVTAVEPSPGMLEVLGPSVPAARAVAGSAEEIPAPASSADAVVAAQAFHWFDLPRALPEIKRVLRPGGTLGVVWNMFDDTVDWVDRMCTLALSEARYAPDEPFEYDLAPWFPQPEQTAFRHTMPVTSDDLVALAASFSVVALLDEPERERVLSEIAELVPEGTTYALPYYANCFRTR